MRVAVLGISGVYWSAHFTIFEILSRRGDPGQARQLADTVLARWRTPWCRGHLAQVPATADRPVRLSHLLEA